MYTIKHAAELVGVSVSTLRAWERRYGVAPATRTEAGYRLYDDEAVRALQLMQRLVSQGWSARQAAEETVRRGREGATAPPPALTAAAAEDLGALAMVAENLDAAGLAAVLDRRFSAASFEIVIDQWLLPALVELGSAWESGRVSVAGEHLVAHGVVRRLSAAYEAASASGQGPRILVGLPAGARHEIGILAFAVAARRVGLHATYLGADVPSTEWARTVEAHRARCVVLAASMPDDLRALRDVTDELATDPGVVVALGGSLQDQAPESCLRLGHEVGPAAARLAEILATR